MKYRLLKEAALRELMEDYDDVTQGELEDMGISDPYEAGVLERPLGDDRWEELRKEVEAKHGPDWEGWWGDGWYRNGKLYESPPDGTIEKLYDDGSASVWYDGRTYKMSKEEMEEQDWVEMPQRLPHNHRSALSGWRKHREGITGHPEYTDDEGDFVGKNREEVSRKDMDDMWNDRSADELYTAYPDMPKGFITGDLRNNAHAIAVRTRKQNSKTPDFYRRRWDDAEAALKRQKALG